MQKLPNENILQTEDEIFDEISSILGGRCAEKVFFAQITNGAEDDLRKAYEIAYKCVTQLGMSKKIGYLAFPQE